MLETGKFPVDQSKVFHWFTLEKKQIERHQWVLGERFGHECDKAYAVWHWCRNHRDDWFKAMRGSGLL